MNQPPNPPTHSLDNHDTLAASALADLTRDDLLALGPGERLWKLYCFHATSGGATHLEHRIYAKLKADGRLALVTFAVYTSAGGESTRSGLARVPDLTVAALDQIIEAIRRETSPAPGEYEEVDLSALQTLDEQLNELGKGR